MQPERRASQFKQTRKQHSMETAEDYTELVYDLIEAKGEARTGTIADALGVSHVTALRSIQRLQEQGFLTTSRQMPVELSDKGKKLALYCKARHQLLVEFFMSIGIPRETAEIDIEGAEHHISSDSLNAIREFMKKPKSSK